MAFPESSPSSLALFTGCLPPLALDHRRLFAPLFILVDIGEALPSPFPLLPQRWSTPPELHTRPPLSPPAYLSVVSEA